MSPQTDDKTPGVKELLLASHLLGFFLFFEKYYRNYLLSSEGSHQGTPSYLLGFLEELSETPWPLSFLNNKFLLFLAMMVILLALLNLHFVLTARYSQLTLMGVYTLNLIYFVGEQRLWTSLGMTLLLFSTIFLLGNQSSKSFWFSLKLFLALCGVEFIFCPNFGLRVTGLVFLGALLLLHRNPTQWSRGLVGLSLCGSAFVVGGEHYAYLGLLVILLGECTNDSSESQNRSVIQILSVLILSVLYGLALANLWWLPRLGGTTPIRRVDTVICVGDPVESVFLRRVEEAKGREVASYLDARTGLKLANSRDRNFQEINSQKWFQGASLVVLGTPNFHRILARKAKENFAPQKVEVRYEVTLFDGTTQGESFR